MGDVNTKSDEINVDVEELVSHIDIVEYISQYLDLEERHGEYWCCCPFHNGDDNASFAINQDKQMWFCQGCKSGGNVYTFAKRFHKLSSAETVVHLCEYAKLDVGDIPAPPDILRYLRKVKKTFNKKTFDVNHKILNKDCMLVYEKRPVKEWLEEGISQEVLDKYDVRYDDLDNSIVFPIYDNDGNIINIKKRTLKADFKLLRKPKYMNCYPVGRLDYLYSFSQNKLLYKNYNDIILFEGEKSCLKAETFGLYNTVALSTSSISKEQANTLIRTGKNIIIAMDKGISLEQVRRTFSYLIRFTNCFIIYDNSNLLEDKCSPIDCGYDIFKQLYNERIKLS